MIKPNQSVPSLPVWVVRGAEIDQVNSAQYLSQGKIILFGVPGAFTPTCSTYHLPGFVQDYDAFKSLGIDKIVCVSVNDHFVMHAWAVENKALESIDFIADFDASLAKALGLERDLRASGLGVRYIRSVMAIDHGIVQAVFIDDKPRTLTNTGATNILDYLRQ